MSGNHERAADAHKVFLPLLHNSMLDRKASLGPTNGLRSPLAEV
jgi:hypothetical protein